MRGQIPWARILAEGVVIVVSILLALGLEAWWSESQERNEEQEVLRGLEADFAVNITQLKDVIEVHEYARAAIAELQAMSAEDMARLPNDSTAKYVRAFRAARSFDARDGTLDAVISSGGLAIITDFRFRNLLVEWKARVEDTEEEVRPLRDLSQRAALRGVQFGGPWRQAGTESAPLPGLAEMTSDLPSANLALLTADAEFMGLVRLKILAGSQYLRELRPLADLAVRIQALIEENQR